MAEIEIIIQDGVLEQITNWLETVVGPIGSPTDAEFFWVYNTRLGTVLVQPNMDMGDRRGVAVWFRSAELPWPSCAACARQAAREMACVVCCDPGEDYPEVNPLAPLFLEVDCHGEWLVLE